MDKPEVRTGTAPVERITNHQFEEMLERARTAEKRVKQLTDAFGVLRAYTLNFLYVSGYGPTVQIHETDGNLALVDQGAELSLPHAMADISARLQMHRTQQVDSVGKAEEDECEREHEDDLKELWDTMPQETKDQIRKLLEAEKSDGSGQ